LAKRSRPSDPATIQLRAARHREAERAAGRDPARWGIDPKIRDLAVNDNVELTTGGRTLRGLRRCDAFSSLWKAGSLSEGQWDASQRYWDDWCYRSGIGAGDRFEFDIVDNGGAAGGATQQMIDAGGRIAEVHKHLGRATARLLAGLVEPFVMRGEVRVWRVLVIQATGEREVHAQGGLVRMALEDLRLAYADIDRDTRARRRREKGGEGAA
jgi:hypothetical protein